ncbi:DUF402 domain-containing protein [Microbacterium protaetiae]|uniref:DUF402 domain-containing protein n=1 Tax=Microbacterium protaetiae TaxID=2509458 RepID=A0A4P6EJM7_9MICO|nr:DUF402 domain-containing protein [Microbacterium protaetiae]QAY61499.1 DUF402 domain-containing protein [Microbacterium protaetiae]
MPDTAKSPQTASTPCFDSGSVVALRSVRSYPGRGNAVGFAVAGRVIVDTPDLSVVCTTVGSDLRRRAGEGSGPRGRLVLAADWDGTHVSAKWRGTAVVRVHERGTPWSVWRWHDGTRWLPGWYINIETPWQRTSLGFDTADGTLDVTVDDARGRWIVEYKDEDELDFLASVGETTPEQVARIRAAGAQAFGLATSRGWPFQADWSPWIPRDPSPAMLPESWKSLGCGASI